MKNFLKYPLIIFGLYTFTYLFNLVLFIFMIVIKSLNPVRSQGRKPKKYLTIIGLKHDFTYTHIWFIAQPSRALQIGNYRAFRRLLRSLFDLQVNFEPIVNALSCKLLRFCYDLSAPMNSLDTYIDYVTCNRFKFARHCSH